MFRKLFCVSLVTIWLVSDGSGFTIQPRIIHGTSSERGQFPYYALLKMIIKDAGNDPFEAICGGTLLNDQFVLTSATCIERAISLQVDLGSHKMNQTNEKGRKSYSINLEQIHFHPEFKKNNLRHALALIKLNEPVTFSDVIQPIKFPNDCSILEDTNLTAIGNGFIVNGFYELPETLQYTELTVPSHEVCCQVYSEIIDFETQFCAGLGFDNKAICFGDLGGPLVHPKQHTLFGVSTYYNTMACEVGPGIFTKVSKYMTWISEVTGLQIPKCSETNNKNTKCEF